MPYYDLFLAPVPNANAETYKAFVDVMQKQMLSGGATEVVDLLGDDVPEGNLTSLPMAVKLEDEETLAAGWVVWPSKDVRDAAWEKMMADDSFGEMPFDGKRIIFGGFSQLQVSRA